MISTPLLALAAGVFGLLGGLATFTAWKTRQIEARFPAQGQVVSFEGETLHLTRRAAIGTSRASVVLLHGASGNQADMMVPLGERLAARGFDVLAPDRPGHGWSDRPGGRADSSPARQAILIRRALGEVGVHHAIIVGHSWSGALALNFALDQPDFTQGVVLVAPATHPWPGGVAAYYRAAAALVLGDLLTRLVTMPLGLALMDKAVAAIFSPQTPPPHYTELTGTALVLRPTEFIANAQDVADLKDFVTEQAPRYAGIRVPTSIVTGDRDAVVLTKVHSYGSARDIPGASLHVLKGIGHSPQHADPQAVVDAVEEVVERGQASVQRGKP